MAIRRTRFILDVILAASVAAGCDPSLPPATSADSTSITRGHESPAVPEAATRTISVAVLPDISASPDTAGRRASLELARSLVRDARPGDHVQVRLIGTSSYGAGMLAADLRVPRRDRRSAFAVSPDADEEYAFAVDSLRRRALAGIDGVADRRLEGTTDIWGSIGAASEVEIHDSVETRVIIVTGDGKDTRKDPLPLTLTGIDFVFQLAPGAEDSTSALYARRDTWSKALLARGAASVSFLAPGERVTLDALRSRASGTTSP